MDARPYTELSFEDKYKLNGLLDREELSLLEKYIRDLESDNTSLQEQVDELEYRCDEMEDDYSPYKEFMEGVVYNHYMQIHKDYNSLDELVEKMEHVLRYE